MHTTFYISLQITKQWIVYLLLYLFSMYYFSKCSICKMDIGRHLGPQVFCWKELWQTAKGWRHLQVFQRNTLLAGFFLVFFLLEQEVISTWKTYESQTIWLFLVPQLLVLDGMACLEDLPPSLIWHTATKPILLQEGAAFKPLCTKIVVFGVRSWPSEL